LYCLCISSTASNRVIQASRDKGLLHGLRPRHNPYGKFAWSRLGIEQADPLVGLAPEVQSMIRVHPKNSADLLTGCIDRGIGGIECGDPCFNQVAERPLVSGRLNVNCVDDARNGCQAGSAIPK
jgi:hypothetical protein